MRAIPFYMILFLVGVGFSCKKKSYPESTSENEIVYYFKADINQSPVSLEAGNGGYYMYSAVQQDVNGVYNFVANLQQGGCTNCSGNSIQIQINDFKVSDLNAPIKIDSSLQINSYSFVMGSSYGVGFRSDYNKTASSYLWNFGDGFTSTLKDPTHVYTKAGIYDVCLTVEGTNGCVSTICNQQKVGLGADVCATDITTVTILGATTLQFAQKTTGTSPFKYLWDFGDGGAKSTLEFPNHTYSTPGSYPVTLKVTDLTGNTATSNFNTMTQNDKSSCAANYQVTSIGTTSAAGSPYALSKVIVKWTDANGVVYSSNNSNQPASSYFQILSIEEYDANEVGQKTKKLHVKFKCTAYNGTNAVTIDNADAVISVAYK